MSQDGPLREHLRKLLDWEDAHVDFDAAVAGIAPDRRGSAPAGIPFSPWQLLEHLRITQQDILDFCVNAAYRERAWPKEYWPASSSPPSDSAWDESVEQYRSYMALHYVDVIEFEGEHIRNFYGDLAALFAQLIEERDPHIAERLRCGVSPISALFATSRLFLNLFAGKCSERDCRRCDRQHLRSSR